VSEDLLFYIGQGCQDGPTSQRWTVFTLGIIYSDLMNMKQRLMSNNCSEQSKSMSYFIWT
jgi:hypothetical protein